MRKIRILATLFFSLVFVQNAFGAKYPMLSKHNFHEYIHALETRDIELLEKRFYSDDFRIYFGKDSMNRKELLEFELTLAQSLNFKFDIEQIVADGSGIAIDAIEHVDILQKTMLPLVGEVHPGEKWKINIIVFYTLTNGKISKINTSFISAEKNE